MQSSTSLFYLSLKTLWALRLYCCEGSQGKAPLWFDDPKEKCGAERRISPLGFYLQKKPKSFIKYKAKLDIFTICHNYFGLCY